eukprot:GHVT01074257.1.p1 GENE.GHVT01074257.1~~GHVT01074257.1.p1  ORF type:complete len:140 (-),score=40.69 GHVT01074257.1:971-1390(-)
MLEHNNYWMPFSRGRSGVITPMKHAELYLPVQTLLAVAGDVAAHSGASEAEAWALAFAAAAAVRADPRLSAIEDSSDLAPRRFEESRRELSRAAGVTVALAYGPPARIEWEAAGIRRAVQVQSAVALCQDAGVGSVGYF